MFLKDVELFKASINIVAYIILGVGSIMLLKIGVAIREVPEILLTAERSQKLGNGD
jgi:hypothetical protein